MSGQRERTAGWSAAAKAEEVRRAGRGGVVRRFLRLLGLDPGAAAVEAEAGRWEAGAVGEEMTAALLAPLGQRGWAGFYDRALPRGRANFDHVLIPPCGSFVSLVDSKLWSARRGHVHRSRDGRLVHGEEDRSGAVRSLLWEARVLRTELARQRVDVRVLPLMVVHSAPVPAGAFTVDGVTVVEARRLLLTLSDLERRPDRERFERLAAAADSILPRYVQGGGR